ncbi:MAG TPA: HEAT repeat domain-containing protein [Candidatus Brocadiia bacterium]|nr:HEAT repeat domain-containing protein [Candidatus Brocadiia bacterium]
MKKIGIVTAILTLACSLAAAQDAPPLRVLLVSGSQEYDSAPSLALLQARLEGDYGAVCMRAFGEDKGNILPGIEQIGKCDVMVVFCRRITLPPEQLALVQKFCEKGGAVVGIRTASHAFQNWPEFDKTVLGGDYQGHFGDEAAEIRIVEAGKSHPVLNGVGDYKGRSKLYKNPGIAKDAVLLMTAKSGGVTMPVTWVRTHNGGRVFYTSLGMPSDFQEENFLKLLINAILWTAGREPSPGSAAKAGAGDDPIASYEHGQSVAALAEIAEQVRASADDPALAAKLEARFINLLRAGATVECKRFVCRQLRMIGTDKSVPALAALLTDAELSHMARYALEGIRTPAANAALLDALGKTKGRLRVGIIETIAARRDVGAVKAIALLTSDADMEVADAAATALGRIGGDEALAGLRGAREGIAPALRGNLVESFLLIAERSVKEGNPDKALGICRELLAGEKDSGSRAAAIRCMLSSGGEGAIEETLDLIRSEPAAVAALAMPALVAIPGEGATKIMASRLEALPVEAQPRLLDVLRLRGDRAALPAVTEATSSKDEATRVAAIAALGRVGDAGSASLLAEKAAKGNPAEKSAAKSALVILAAPGVDEAMIASLPKSDEQTQIEFIRAFIDRDARAAVPALVKVVSGGAGKARMEAMKALGELGGDENLPLLLDIMTRSEGKDTRFGAENAVGQICRRSVEKGKCAELLSGAYPDASVPAKCSILRVLGTIGGTQALAMHRTAITDAAGEIQDTAARGLSDWPDATPTDDLLKMARESAKETHRVLALRGYLRMIELPGNRPADERLAMCRTAMETARRVEEKKLAVAAVARIEDERAIEMIVGMMVDEELRAEACGGIIRMAGEKSMRKKLPTQLQAALNKVIAISKDANQIKDAKDRLGKF